MDMFTEADYREVVPHMLARHVDEIAHWAAAHLRSAEAYGQFMYVTAGIAGRLRREIQSRESPTPVDFWLLRVPDSAEINGAAPIVQALRMVTAACNKDDETLFALVLVAINAGDEHGRDVIGCLVRLTADTYDEAVGPHAG